MSGSRTLENVTAELERCFACGGTFRRSDGATHPYMLSTAGCWEAFGEVLAREYENPALFGAVHRLTVDAYALQHPGDGSDRRATRSVWIHHAALQLEIEFGKPLAAIPSLMQKLAGRSFPPLPEGPKAFDITHESVLSRPPAEHVAAVRAWARCAYEGWHMLRAPTRRMLAAL